MFKMAVIESQSEREIDIKDIMSDYLCIHMYHTLTSFIVRRCAVIFFMSLVALMYRVKNSTF